MDPGVIAVIGLCVFLALWYGGGYLYNRRNGQRLFRWLEQGLGAWGGPWESTWIGSPASGVRVSTPQPARPFQQVEAILLLENREILPFWLLDRLRGRQDWLILKATLDRLRPAELEAVPARSRIAQRLRDQTEKPWQWREGPHGLAVAYRGAGARQQAERLWPWLESYGAQVDRFSWRREEPHVQVQMRVGGLLGGPSERLLADFRTAILGTAEA